MRDVRNERPPTEGPVEMVERITGGVCAPVGYADRVYVTLRFNDHHDFGLTPTDAQTVMAMLAELLQALPMEVDDAGSRGKRVLPSH